jgi:hypothetical protein
VEDESERPIGICVSGGGIRAASFGLGALQALQDEAGLLRGENAADYLSAVSGGSYVAGAYALVNCSDRFRPADSPDGTQGIAPGIGSNGGSLAPLAPGSPEAEHLRRHCRYMIEDGGVRTSSRMLLLIVVNLLTVASIVWWFGVMLGDYGMVGSLLLPPEIDSPEGLVALQWALAAVAIGLAGWLIHQVGNGAPAKRTRLRTLAGVVLWLLGMAVFCVSTTALATRVTTVPLFAGPEWIVDNALVVAGSVLAIVVITGLLGALSRRIRRGAPTLQRLNRAGVVFLTLRVVQFGAVLLVAWAIAWMYTAYKDSGSALPLLVFFGALSAPLVLQRFIDRASPHHPYRDMLTRCFSVIRTGDTTAARPHDPNRVLLSELTPPPPRQADSFPELVICAAANLSDVGSTPAGTNALSLVLTPRHLSIPAANVEVPIEALERYRRPTALGRGWGPAITLPSAVAMTGAAVSPAMGRQTRTYLRALFTTLNIRLGVWLPNVLRQDTRDQAETARDDASDSQRVKVTMDELVQELFGMHSSKARMLYVSDGGHYDNLGLVELLRRRCRVIWCIDASGDVPGRATALAEAILVASGDLGARVEIELDRFELADELKLKDAVLTHSHAVGTVHYADRSTGTIVVIKLGLTADSPDNLHEYRRKDRAFPHHSTLNQVFRADRFDAYRSLGWDSAYRAITDDDVVAAVRAAT